MPTSYDDEVMLSHRSECCFYFSLLWRKAAMRPNTNPNFGSFII